MSTATNHFPTRARPAVERYIHRGLATVPLPVRTKKPDFPGWEKLLVTLANVDEYFPADAELNIGVLNGRPSGNLADVDLDSDEAIAAASHLLPPTGWCFGRASAPQSHRLYVTDQPLDTASLAFKDLDGAVLVELRGTGGQTVFPPSVHRDTGELIAWHSYTDPAQVPLGDLRRHVHELAACALLARHWPAEGSRDTAALALSGGLIRAGWEHERVSTFVHAVAVAAGDEEARVRRAKAAPTARKQEDGKKTTGWPRLAKLLGRQGDDVVEQVRIWLDVLRAAPAGGSVPEPLPWPAPPGEEAFHGLAGRIVQTISPASEADPTALLVQTLVAFGSVVGRMPHFIVESDQHRGNEFVVLVGRTAKARKGTSWGRIAQLFRETEERWAVDCVQSGLSSAEGLIWAVRDPITKREKVSGKGESARFEDVEADPGIEDKRLLVYEPEFANVLKQTERQGNTLSAVLRNAWDGRDLRTLVKNSPARATGAHISVVGHITADEVRRCLTQTEAANGFGNRHLWLCADRSKVLPDGGQIDKGAWGALRNELATAITSARSVEVMARDAEAGVIWRKVYGPLSKGRPGLAGAMLDRAEAHVMRLAMLYALLDRSAAIGASHLLAALALWDYVERSVYFVFGEELGDPVADELLRLLRSCPDGLTRNDVMNYFGRNQSSARIGRAFGLLLQHGLARRDAQETGGRPAERWYAGHGKPRP